MTNIANNELYLDRLSRPMQEKLRILNYFPDNPRSILDVGCADGSVTYEIAKIYPNSQATGVDVNEKFIELAKKNHNLPNLNFIHSFQRELLNEKKRHDIVTFISVLHEFYSYGEGTSTVVKALADAHELINQNGRIIIRDMILCHYSKHSNLFLDNIINKIKNTQYSNLLSSFEDKYGQINSLNNLNHFLLKYLYADNWEHELQENYVGINFDQYEQLATLLNLKILYKESYLIEFLKNKWKEDFDLTELEISPLRSTGILVFEK